MKNIFDYICSMGFRKKILITGVSGFVGSRVAEALQNEYTLITPSHGELDITSEEAVENFIDSNRPDVILHLAALSNTGYCEEHPDESYLANADALAGFIREAKERGLDIICQCDYGQSRSAACAAAILQHFECRGIDIFADYRYYPNQLVYHKIFDALEKVK